MRPSILTFNRPWFCRLLGGSAPSVLSDAAGSAGSSLYQVSNGQLRSITYGQPVPQTHPELLQNGELTVGITAAEYWQRRQRLAAMMMPGSVAVLPSAATIYMSGVVPFPYRPDPDFTYCTGITQHAVAVLQAGPSKDSRSRLVLFIEPPNPDRDKWDGPRLDKDAAEAFGADEVHYTTEIPKRLAQLCSAALSSGAIYFDPDRTTGHLHSTVQATIARALENSARSAATASPSNNQAQAAVGRQYHTSKTAAPEPGRLLLLRPLLHELRLVKSAAEATRMRLAAEAAASGITACMRATEPGGTEWQLAAQFEHHCKMLGAQRMAYPQVVASGADAYYTHYGRNDKQLRAGDLVLMDAGCELHGYASDVTRTWPINGKFSGPQRDVYDAVLQVHHKCLEASRPGSSIRDLHQMSVKLISEAIKDLGLCGSASLSDIANSRYRQFYWHSVGHWLGSDVHDTSLISHSRQLTPGNVITIEPGIYVPDEDRFGPLRGIGVRIEDDVLIVPGGCEVLSQGVPTSRHEVEELVGSKALALHRR